jgi:superfamily II DNA or RNA helicase
MYLKTPKSEIIVFQAPTGSGKTITMARFIQDIAEESDEDVCFLWISIGRGDLHRQSQKSVKKEIGEAIDCSVLEDEFFGSRNIINRNEVVFINWEKIRAKDKETNEFTNVLMKDSENNNFPLILENTRNNDRKIILIIDESHSSSTTERALEIRNEIIQPNLTIEMSATPILTNNMNTRVEVDPVDVINQGMIKKEIIINDKIAEIIKNEEEEKTSELLVLESTYYKQEELKRRYDELYNSGECKTKITPLTLIQLPNSSYGEQKRESVEKFLENKGITTSNGRLAIWLSDEKINEEADILNSLDSKVEYLIFKMAIDTGWDCPRAQILLKFRETNSIIFEIQTVGRILRMPEAKHYSDEVLNKAYVYTNIQSITIKKEVYNPNIIKSYVSNVKDEYTSPISNISTNNAESNASKQLENGLENEYDKVVESITSGNYQKTKPSFFASDKSIQGNLLSINDENANLTSEPNANEIPEVKEVKKKPVITLTSYYKKRVDFGDITTSFYAVYEKCFCENFGITKVKDSTSEYDENKNKLKDKGITFNLRKKDSILTDVHIESKDVDNEKLQLDYSKSLVDIDMSESDLQYDFEKVITNNLNGFAPVRSISTVKMAIINTFTKYLNIKPANKGIVLIQNLIINNSDKFGKIINTATDKYKPIHEMEVDNKVGYELNENWHIPMSKNYNPNTSTEIDSKLSIHQPLYMETKDGKTDQLEIDFIKYLDKKDNFIDYFWKNGSEHMNTNFGIKKRDGSTFQPDFLIQFKDGRIGIFDTKAGKGFNENDNKEKSEALIQYIVDENKKGKNIVGGLVIRNNDKWLYYDRGVYKSYKEDPNSWYSFDDLLK